MLVDAGEDPALNVDVTFYSPEEYKKIFTTNGQFTEKYSTAVCVYDLPYMFNDLKIAPRNITIEFED